MNHSYNNYRSPKFNNDMDIKFFIHATTNIISSLHEGEEYPFECIHGINATFEILPTLMYENISSTFLEYKGYCGYDIFLKSS